MDIKALEAIALSVRALSMDAIQKANSGHPGLPLGAAELGAVLYGEILRHDPAAPDWPDRDRFVLSAGHGSMLLYALLHLSGYADMTIEDIKNFRQPGSRAAGHPEYGLARGIEATTGPLGQGLAMAAGMAVAETMLAARFNTAAHRIVDHRTWVLAGDGCLQEGVSAEASSLAGHLGLGKLTVFYDSNRITIDGSTDIAFTEDAGKRYEAYGWQVLRGSMYDIAGIAALVEEAKADTERPSLIILESIIGKGAPGKQGGAEVHGAPLGAEEIARARANLGIPPDADFYAAPEARAYFAKKQGDWAQARAVWEKQFEMWSAENPEKRAEWDMFHENTGTGLEGGAPPYGRAGVPPYPPNGGAKPPRNAPPASPGDAALSGKPDDSAGGCMLPPGTKPPAGNPPGAAGLRSAGEASGSSAALPARAAPALPVFSAGEMIATRAAGQKALQALALIHTNLVGGSADLKGPNAVALPAEAGTYGLADRAGRYIHFGIREFGMAAIANGIQLHGGLRAYCATFMVFADYLRAALRLSALMKQPVIYVLTHDSIFVGEDGPTHQPVEHLASLRAIPGLRVLRPADAEEAALAWEMALERRDGPTALALSRQNLPVLEKAGPGWRDTARRAGAYIVRDAPGGSPGTVILATGSEVSMALEAASLAPDASKTRVVSVLCRELFFALDRAAREAFVPPGARVLVAEAGAAQGWERVAPPENILSIERFGESAPAAKVAASLGFTAQALAAMIQAGA